MQPEVAHEGVGGGDDVVGLGRDPEAGQLRGVVGREAGGVVREEHRPGAAGARGLHGRRRPRDERIAEVQRPVEIEHVAAEPAVAVGSQPGPQALGLGQQVVGERLVPGPARRRR